MVISDRAFRESNANKIASRTRALETRISSWLSSFGRSLLREMIDTIRRGGSPDSALQGADDFTRQQLTTILTQFGLRQLGDSGKEFSPGVDIVTRQFESDFIRQKTVQVQQIADNIKDEFREGVSGNMADWLQEDPQPSIGEIARRLRSMYFTRGPEPAKLEGIPADRGGRGLVRTVGGRAELIARTEVAMARTEGRARSMEAAGIPFKRWSAFTDGKSGDRHHERMDGETIPFADLFVLPSGTRMRWPSDSRAPIGETANCRCTLIPERRARPST